MQDLNDLAYFAAIADAGGIAPASRALGVPKSKLSRRLALLEERMGLRLAQRTTRRFALTEVGEAVLRHARAMRAEADAAEALTAEQATEPRGSVRLSCPPALLQHGVGDMLARYLNAWPQVTLQVEATNRNIDVWHDGVDLALRVRPHGASLPAEETVRALAVSPHLLVAAPNLLTHVSLPTTPAELAALPSLGLGNSPEQERWCLRGPRGEEREVVHHPRLVVNDMSALLCAALAGVGYTALPRLLAHTALEQGDLQALLPNWTPPPGQIQAVFASRRGMRPAVRALIEALVTGFDQLVQRGHCLSANQ